MYEQFMQKVDIIGRVLVAGMLGIAISFVFLDAMLRSLMSYSIFWVQEIVLYLIIWSTFLGAGLAVRKNDHIKVSFVIERLPQSLQFYVNIGTSMIGLVFSGALVISGIRLVLDAYSSGVVSISTLETPLWLPYMIMPIAGGLFGLGFVERFISLCQRKAG